MAQIDSPATRAYRQLMELARSEGTSVVPQLFALTWLAAGRMVAVRGVTGITAVDELIESSAWNVLLEAGLPVEAFDIIVTQRASTHAQEVGRRASAAAIVSELAKELGAYRWDILPCLTESAGRREDSLGTLAPELASLLMDMTDAPPGSEVWIPFDQTGQLTVEALRRGWKVLAASPLPSWQLVRQLVLTVETGEAQPAVVRVEAERDQEGRSVAQADYALVVPPFGMSVKDSRLSMWDITGIRAYEQYARSESWALFEFANRVTKRAVVVTPQGVLFTQGQELRLREYLLRPQVGGNRLEAVIALPPGVFGSTVMAGAVLVLTPTNGAEAVYMAELGSGRRTIQDAGNIVETERAVALSRQASAKARLVSRAEIEANEFSFAPSRYLRRIADLGDAAVKLGDICEVLRPPTLSKDAGTFEVVEVGQPDLHRWQPIHQVRGKTVWLKTRPKNTVLVCSGDIVLSIKGSVGRVALMGAAAEARPTVVSQSCIALRLDPRRHDKNLSPEVLLLYLRSPHGQAQIAGLQVGAGVQHISSGTLTSSVSIPLPSSQTCMDIRQDYERLCRLEAEVDRIQAEIADITDRRWTAESK